MSKPRVLVAPILLKCHRWMFLVHCADCGQFKCYTPSIAIAVRLEKAHKGACPANPWRLEKAG